KRTLLTEPRRLPVIPVPGKSWRHGFSVPDQDQTLNLIEGEERIHPMDFWNIGFPRRYISILPSHIDLSNHGQSAWKYQPRPSRLTLPLRSMILPVVETANRHRIPLHLCL